jgi:hypothetical protein
MSEDHDYVRRAAQHGKFGLLTGVRIPVSMRRLEKEGIVGLALKYLWCEMYALAGKPIRSMPFEYEFGAFQPKEARWKRPLINVAELRSRLGKFTNPIQSMSSAGLDQLRRVAEFDAVDFAVKRIQLLLERHDVDILEYYIQQRLAVSKQYQGLNKMLSKLKSAPGEIIRIVDTSRLRIFGPDDDESSDNEE